jgi:hypothetical protein
MLPVPGLLHCGIDNLHSLALPIINFTEFVADSAVSYLFSNNSTLSPAIA